MKRICAGTNLTIDEIDKKIINSNKKESMVESSVLNIMFSDENEEEQFKMIKAEKKEGRRTRSRKRYPIVIMYSRRYLPMTMAMNVFVQNKFTLF